MLATYKSGWKIFTCPACADTKQNVPKDLQYPGSKTSLARIASAMSKTMCELKCTSCDSPIQLVLDESPIPAEKLDPEKAKLIKELEDRQAQEMKDLRAKLNG